ncbi:hypothetical protein BaRGS_00000326, partial [Batillaria attramentaria]
MKRNAPPEILIASDSNQIQLTMPFVNAPLLNTFLLRLSWTALSVKSIMTVAWFTTASLHLESFDTGHRLDIKATE